MILLLVCLLTMLALMAVFQRLLDKTRRISRHALIRNTITVVAVWYLASHPWSWWVFVTPFIVEAFLQNLFKSGVVLLDPEDNLAANMYAFLDDIVATNSELRFYSEGLRQGDLDLPEQEAQERKYAWLREKGMISKGTRVMEIGMGNGDFLLGCKEVGAQPNGIAVSPDNVRVCMSKGLEDVHTMDFWELESETMHSRGFYQNFDVVVLNGSIEHFYRRAYGCSPDELFTRMFKICHDLIDPASSSGRVVITCLHLRLEPHDFKKWGLFALRGFWHLFNLGVSFGGRYPRGVDGLTRNAKQWFQIVEQHDRTDEYDWYSDRYMKNARNLRAVLNVLKNSPVFLLNDPFYWNKLFLFWTPMPVRLLFKLQNRRYGVVDQNPFGSWSWQFKAIHNLYPPPALHQWIVLKDKEVG